MIEMARTRIGTKIGKIHLSRLDSETTYCGKNINTTICGKQIDINRMVADIEKVTCKSCVRLHDEELGISVNYLDPEQVLTYWSKVECEPNCHSLMVDKFNLDKIGCIVTATANPLVEIFRLGTYEKIIVPLFI